MNIKMKITKDETITELEINNPDEAVKVLLIQNVFNLYGGNVDMSEVLSLISRIGKSYEHFYKHMKSLEEPVTVIEKESNLEAKSKEIKTQMIDGYIEQSEKSQIEINPEEIKNAIIRWEEDNGYERTGIKIKNGIKHYKLRYECPVCKNRSNHVIPLRTESVYCHKCGRDMKVKLAHPDSTENNMIPDTFLNFYRAGTFRDRNIWRE